MSYPFRRRRRHNSQAEAVQSAVWMIGLGVMFLTGWWWPGMLILGGLSLVLGAVAENAFPAEQEPEPAPRTARPQRSAPPPTPFAAEPAAPARPAPEPARPIRLPDLCPHCGAPPRSLRSVTPEHPFECPYCGSDLEAASA